MLFDDDNKSITFSINDSLTSYFAGMPYFNDGWKPKKIFIANKAATETATFKYTFMGAMMIKSTLIGIVVMATSIS